jgi:hypothetical protein
VTLENILKNKENKTFKMNYIFQFLLLKLVNSTSFQSVLNTDRELAFVRNEGKLKVPYLLKNKK